MLPKHLRPLPLLVNPPNNPRVIVGLGNPGVEYAATRHNVGQRVVAHAAAEWSIPLHLNGLTQRGTGRIHGHPVTLALPVTFMNVSGEAVEELVTAHDVQARDVIVVHDDLDLPIGCLRIRPGGGTGGHKGLRSIMMALGTEAFVRLKIGIGRPAPEVDPADFVLAPFTPSELEELQPVLTQAVEGLACLVTHDVQEAMNRFNRRLPGVSHETAKGNDPREDAV